MSRQTKRPFGGLLQPVPQLRHRTALDGYTKGLRSLFRWRLPRPQVYRAYYRMDTHTRVIRYGSREINVEDGRLGYQMTVLQARMAALTEQGVELARRCAARLPPYTNNHEKKGRRR